MQSTSTGTAASVSDNEPRGKFATAADLEQRLDEVFARWRHSARYNRERVEVDPSPVNEFRMRRDCHRSLAAIREIEQQVTVWCDRHAHKKITEAENIEALLRHRAGRYRQAISLSDPRRRGGLHPFTRSVRSVPGHLKKHIVNF